MSDSLSYNPTGNGDIIQLNCIPWNDGQANWQHEADSSDDTVVVVGQDLGYQYDVYRISAQEEAANKVIDDVTVYIRCMNDSDLNSYNKWRAAIYTHGNLYGGTEQGLYWQYWYENVWMDWSHTWTVNPYTGQKWTWAEIVAMQIGVGLRTNDGYVRCAKVSATVHYTLHNCACRAQIVGMW